MRITLTRRRFVTPALRLDNIKPLDVQCCGLSMELSARIDFPIKRLK